MTTRSDIWKALANTLRTNAAATFPTISRRFKYPDQVSGVQMPALYIVQDHESHDRREAIPDKRVFSGRLIIYTRVEQASDSEDDVPADEMNAALDAVEAALEPAPWPNVQTLGGKVAHCWIEGETLMETGDTDGLGLAVVPVKILVP